jgi:hypothetical protein
VSAIIEGAMKRLAGWTPRTPDAYSIPMPILCKQAAEEICKLPVPERTHVPEKAPEALAVLSKKQ